MPTVGTVLTAINTSITALDTQTPAHADNFNAIFKQLLDNDLTLDKQTNDTIRALRINVIDLAIELETLKKGTLNGVTANMAVETFINTNDITSLNGALKFDATNQKIYLA